MTKASLDDIRAQLREQVHIADLLARQGQKVRLSENGRATVRCPFHDDHRPSMSVRIDPKDGKEKFVCFVCNVHGDLFDFVQLLEESPDHLTVLRSLAEEHGIKWPDDVRTTAPEPPSVLTRAAKFYNRQLTPEVLAYLANRGFPEAFVRQQLIGYAPPTETRTTLTESVNKAGKTEEALDAKILVHDNRTKELRDFFGSDRWGYIIFPNLAGKDKVVDLQGRIYPDAGARNKYLNLPGEIRFLYNLRGANALQVILCEGIPDTLSIMLANLKGFGVVGIYGMQAWKDSWLGLFRRAQVVYVALDRDATDKAIQLARKFGTRGRVLIPPEILGPKGDNNDWLRGPANKNPETFRALLQDALPQSPTPWALMIDRLPGTLQPWDLEGNDTARQLLTDLGHHSTLSRGVHLERLARKVGVQDFRILERAALELARQNGAHP